MTAAAASMLVTGGISGCYAVRRTSVLDAKRRKASVVHLVQCTKHQQRLQGNTAYSAVAVDQSWQLSYVMYSGQLRMTYDQSVQQLIDSVDVVAASFAALAWPALYFPRRECRRRQRAGSLTFPHAPTHAALMVVFRLRAVPVHGPRYV